MTDTKIYDTTGKQIKSKSLKRKTAQDAKRYRQLLLWLETRIATLTIAGQVLSTSDVPGLAGTLDEQIDETVKEKRKMDERKRRADRVKDKTRDAE